VLVGRIGALGDDAFQSVGARVAPGLLAVLHPVRGEAQPTIERQNAAQNQLSLEEREPSEIEPAGVNDIERVEVHGDARSLRSRRVAQLHAALQPREAGSLSLERDDLTVEDVVARGLCPERLFDLRILPVERELVARQEPHSAPVAKDQTANAVELRLEDPARVGEAVVGERGQHRRHPPRHRSFTQPRSCLRGQRRDGGGVAQWLVACAALSTIASAPSACAQCAQQ